MKHFLCSPSTSDTNHALMSWVFPSAQRTISYNEFKPATDMVLSTFFAHASELVPLPKITSHLRLVGPIRATPSTRSIAVASVPISLSSPLRCSTWRQSKAGLSISCMCITIKREFGVCFTKISQFTDTPKRRPSTLDNQLARISARATKCFDMPVCQQSACTFCFALHDGHGVLHHVSGATSATVRSMSPRSSLLRSVYIPWQTPLVGPLGSSERTFCQYTSANSHSKNMSADMLKKAAHLTVLAVVPTAPSEANTEHGIYRIS